MGWTSLMKTMLGSTFQLNADDIVVFVVGPTGSGKSTFVRAVTQAHGLVDVGQSLRPTSRKVQAIRCKLPVNARMVLDVKEQKNIVFVDTPSFLTDPWRSSTAEKEMNIWLKKSKCKATHFGTIYMHRVEIDPRADVSNLVQRQLDAFAGTFPRELAMRAFPQRLHCVLSCVDRVKESKITDHRNKFEKQLNELHPRIVNGWRPKWRTSIHSDLLIRGDPDVAWAAVEVLFLDHDQGDLPRKPSR